MDIRISIIDDKQNDIDSLINQLNQWSKISSHSVTVTQYLSPLHAISDFEDNIMAFDLLIVDVMMPNMNGIEFIKEIRRFDPTILVVLTSSNKNFAIDGYSVYAFDFLTKPVSFDRLADIMERIVNRLITINTPSFCFTSKGQNYKIPISEILYIDVFGNNSTIHTLSEQSYMIRCTLKGLINELPNYFIKINRNTIINGSYIISFTDKRVQLKNMPDDFPIAKSSYNDIRRVFYKIN